MPFDPFKVRARYALMVDHFTVTADNKEVLVGVFDRILVPRMANGGIVFGTGFVVAKLQAELVAGPVHRFRMNLVNESGQVVSEGPEEEFTLSVAGDGMGLRHSFAIKLQAIAVPDFGHYCWALVVDGEIIAECPFWVIERQIPA